MSDDNALPNKAAETDSTPPPIAQQDHLAPDPTATPAPRLNLFASAFPQARALLLVVHYSEH